MNVSLWFAPYRPKRSWEELIVSLSEVGRKKIRETNNRANDQQQTTASFFLQNKFLNLNREEILLKISNLENFPTEHTCEKSTGRSFNDALT